MGVLSNLEPKEVFHYFEEICGIPHASYKEKQISDYCVKFAKDRGLAVTQDDLGNVIIIKDATPGYEDKEPIILQGHLDMVCEKEADCDIDFDKEGLRLAIDGDWIKAEGTTLGGDDGIAVAMGLAILDSKTIKHPRLEVVFTVSEEVGMEGASGIDLSSLKGHRLLNLDSEKEGEFLVSCAGGAHAEIGMPVKRTKESGSLMKLSVTGLLGGHSGDEIDKQRANADKTIVRVLDLLKESVSFGLVDLFGGLKDNAIPREANAYITLLEGDTEKAKDALKSIETAIRGEFAVSDPDLKISLREATAEEAGKCKERVGEGVLTQEDMARVLDFLNITPNGVQRMCMDMPGLVETSLNLGIMTMEADHFTVHYSVRSSVKSCKEQLLRQLKTFADRFDCTYKVGGDYPAWEYKGKTPFLNLIVDTYQKRTGKEPLVRSIHAGLECGLIAQKIKDLDAVSLGPDIPDIHTPKERLGISSTKRVWEFVLDVLRHG
ncbi:MAG: aminoacyl-histidine dipeptidase [Lachnospiraceae bacterium]|nr:aminoacyl-histidine dipeptidase [Lachnospiraceae bacterium]